MSTLKSYYAEKKVLITGGAGFIGSNLAGRLADLGSHVLLVDSLIPEYGGNLANIRGIEDRVKLNISDVRDEHSLRYLVKDQDILFNLAGQTSHLDSMQRPNDDLEINSRAQLSILETCRHHNPGIRIVFASTRQLYGRPDYLPVDEKHPLRPVDVNGINKLAGEFYHLLYQQVYGIPTCVLRLTNTYGPRMRIRDARQTFLGIWIRHALQGEPFEVWGGEQLRDLNYIDDVVAALLLTGERPEAIGQVFNLGDTEVISLRRLAEILAEIVPAAHFNIREYPAERKKIDIGDFYSDFSKIKNLLGWEPTVSLTEGLRRTLDYYRPNLALYS